MEFDGCCSRRRAALLLLIFVLATCTVFAEEGVLVLVVTDTEQHPFANVEIGTAGDGGSPQFTDQNGKARLKLPPNTKPAAWVNLLLLNAPNGLDLAFISPFDARVRVPPFDNEAENYDPVVLAKRGDKSMLESGSGMLALHAAINRPAADQKKKPGAPASQKKLGNPATLGYAVPRLQLVSLIDERTPAYGRSGTAIQENPPQAQDVTATVTDCTNNVSAQRRALEERILVLINEQRQQQGIGPLEANEPLSQVARQHSCRMMALNFFDHVDPELGGTGERLHSAKVHVTSASENLAVETSPSDPASHAIELWRSDPEHLDNMMSNDFGCAGVGVAIKPNATYLVTEISSAKPCPRSASSPAGHDLQTASLIRASEKFGLPVPDVETAIKKWGGTNLTWKIVALQTSLTSGTDPFVAVHSSSNDIVFGIGSWSLRECNLQPLLMKLQERDPKRFAEIIGPDAVWLSETMRKPCPISSKAALQRMIQGSEGLTEVWRTRLRNLGYEPEFQHVQVEQMTVQVEKAQAEASTLGLESERGVAFCQDVVMRHSSLRTALQEDYRRDLAAFTHQTGQRPDEEVKLLLLMNLSIKWNSMQAGEFPEEAARFDAQARLLAEGNGFVSGRQYDLSDYGIGLTDLRTSLEMPRHTDPAILQKLAEGWIPGANGS